MWNLIFKNDKNQLMYKTETDLQIPKTNTVTKGGGRINQKPEINEHILLYIYKRDNQQGPTVQHRERHSIFSNNL